MPLDLTDDKSTLVQVMAWCRQATSHYLRQCWPRFMSPYGVTRPQWVNEQHPCFQKLAMILKISLHITWKKNAMKSLDQMSIKSNWEMYIYITNYHISAYCWYSLSHLFISTCIETVGFYNKNVLILQWKCLDFTYATYLIWYNGLLLYAMFEPQPSHSRPSMLITKCEKHLLLHILGGKNTPFFNWNHWFWGSIKHPLFKQNMMLMLVPLYIKYMHLFCESEYNCIKLKTFFCVHVHCVFIPS